MREPSTGRGTESTNRVGGSIKLPPPTPPGMRVRSGRFTMMEHTDHRASSWCADSPRGCRPSMAFVSLGSQLCRRLPSDRASRVGPCLELAVGVNIVDGGPPAGDFHPMSPRPCRAYTLHAPDAWSWHGFGHETAAPDDAGSML